MGRYDSWYAAYGSFPIRSEPPDHDPAAKAGAKAFADGLLLGDNPYDQYLQIWDHDFWACGWRMASEAARKEHAPCESSN